MDDVGWHTRVDGESRPRARRRITLDRNRASPKEQCDSKQRTWILLWFAALWRSSCQPFPFLHIRRLKRNLAPTALRR
jgi:hypothetical protein